MTVVASDVYTLSEYAADVLTVAENALATTDEGTPDMAYISTERPAFDCCPALIVTVPNLAYAPTAPVTPIEATALRFKHGGLILAAYNIYVLRCAATGQNGNPPSASAMTAVAQQTHQDIWALWNGIRDAVDDGSLFETCTGIHIDQARPVEEQGMCVGWILPVRAMIPGIPG